jgi:hypothetical protein
MPPELRRSMMSAHRANIRRYDRILETFLTAHERSFVERRFAEEEAALNRLAGLEVNPSGAFAGISSGIGFGGASIGRGPCLASDEGT